jgi:proteic killer suppression protein
LALSAAETLDEMRSVSGRCHELKHDWSGHLALDLAGGMRLVFRPGEWVENAVGGLDWCAVTTVVIVAVEDYH